MKSVNPCESVILTVYDIVKAHSGELKSETKEGEGNGLEGLTDYTDHTDCCYA